MAYQRVFFSTGPFLPLACVGWWLLPTLCTWAPPPLDLLASIAFWASLRRDLIPAAGVVVSAESLEGMFDELGLLLDSGVVMVTLSVVLLRRAMLPAMQRAHRCGKSRPGKTTGKMSTNQP